MDPNQPQTPPATPPANEPPADDTPPSWAQSIIDSQADITNRLTAFEESQQAPEPPITPTPDPQEPWTPKSWSDVDARAEERAKEIVTSTLAEQRAAETAAQEQATNQAREVDQFLDSQVADLTKDNKLPAVTNDNDPNDPGKLAQRELYGFALSLGTADLKTSYNTLQVLHNAGKAFDFVKMELVDKNPAAAGMNSPVGSSSSGASGVSTKPDYKTIHNTSLDALAARFSQ